MKKAEFEKSKTKFGDIPSIFNFLKEDSDILSNESK
jgi:hypothetical protein